MPVIIPQILIRNLARKAKENMAEFDAEMKKVADIVGVKKSPKTDNRYVTFSLPVNPESVEYKNQLCPCGCKQVVGKGYVRHETENAVTDDPINPNHYKRLGEYAPNIVLRKWGLGFNLGQVLKYIGRAGFKPGASKLEDLKKAAWYLNDEIEQMENDKK